MPLIVSIPSSCWAQRAYVVDVILRRYIGLDFEMVNGGGGGWRIYDTEGEKDLLMPDVFLGKAHKNWLAIETLPETPLPKWKVPEEVVADTLINSGIPVIAGAQNEKGEWFHQSDTHSVYLGLDVFGAAFFMLSRYEELVVADRDEHDRFPAKASLAYKGKFLDRPIIDEYSEILRGVMKILWPRLEYQTHEGKTLVTCDVDTPYDATTRSFKRLLRATSGDLIKRKNPSLTLRRMQNAFKVHRDDYSIDPNNTFRWMMDTCEQHGHHMAFYFIAGRTDGLTSRVRYQLDEPFIQKLLKQIHYRGHEIGMHGSYVTFRDGSLMAHERQKLITACEKAGIDADVVGNRQHYLRWDSAITPDLLEQVGFHYDTTGGYADRPGFRYGTARSFPMWSWVQNRALRLQQRPLIVMECSVIADSGMGLGRSDNALKIMRRLKKRSLQYGGTFVLLWHNSSLKTEEDRELYKCLSSF